MQVHFDAERLLDGEAAAALLQRCFPGLVRKAQSAHQVSLGRSANTAAAGTRTAADAEAGVGLPPLLAGCVVNFGAMRVEGLPAAFVF